MKLSNLKKFCHFGVWGLETLFGPLGPKIQLSHISWTQTPIFTYRTLFYPESWVAFNKIMKYQKISSLWGLGPRNYIWAAWAQKTYQAITPEPYHQFSHKGSHFIQNHKLLSIISWNLKKCCPFGVWGLETIFGPLGP